VTDMAPYLAQIVAHFTEAAAQNAALPARTVQFTFSDSGEVWAVRYGGGEPATSSRETLEKPDVAVTAPSDVMAGILDKKINGTMAYMQRKIQVKGAMDDLLRLQKLIL
jgi:putative sterol carrier protein